MPALKVYSNFRTKDLGQIMSSRKRPKKGKNPGLEPHVTLRATVSSIQGEMETKYTGINSRGMRWPFFLLNSMCKLISHNY